MEYSSSFLVALIIFGLVYWLGTRTFDRFSKSGVKNVKPFPFIGNVGRMFLWEHLTEFMDRIYSSFPKESYIGAYEFQLPVLWLRDPDLIRQIAVKETENFLDHRNAFHPKLDPILYNMLNNLQGQKWKDMRAAMTPVFTTSKIKAMLPFMKEISEEMIRHIDGQFTKLKPDEKVLEIESKGILLKFANDVIASCAFGLNVNSFEDSGTNVFYRMASKVLINNVRLFFRYVAVTQLTKISEIFGISVLDPKVGQYFNKLINDTMRSREEQGVLRPDLIHLLMQAKKGTLKDDGISDTKEDTLFESISTQNYKVKKSWTENEITAQAMIFFLAGYESVSTVAAFAISQLALNQDFQNKMYEEVKQARSKGDLTYETLMELKYLDMFISECLRLYPTLPGTDRVCSKTITLPVPPNDQSGKKYKIMPGEVIFIPIRCLQRDPENFPNPDRFDPERFSDQNKGSIKPYTYMPFGVGPRACIGRRFALMEEKCILFYVISHYRVLPCSRTRDPRTVPIKFISTDPLGMWVGLEKRSI